MCETDEQKKVEEWVNFTCWSCDGGSTTEAEEDGTGGSRAAVEEAGMESD